MKTLGIFNKESNSFKYIKNKWGFLKQNKIKSTSLKYIQNTNLLLKGFFIPRKPSLTLFINYLG